MTIYRKIGLLLIILGVIIFLFAASTFSYSGEINPFISKIGMYSFVFWLPTIALGIILVLIKIGKRKILDKTNEDKAE